MGIMTESVRQNRGPSAPAAEDTPDLRALSLRSLADSYDRSRHLFSHQLFDGSWREIDDLYQHETLTSSCIALLGLFRAGVEPAELGVDVPAALDAIADEVGRTGYLGGLGLAVWANAVAGGSRNATGYLQRAGVAERRLLDEVLPTLTTMETAWLASGLLHEVARNDTVATRSSAQRVVDELRTNRYVGATRLMRHAGAAAATTDRLRGHIANFADQIYSVQAFAFAGLVLDDRAALGAGAALADRHCELQGPLGQWWWHYDADRGHVALRYAVYSVHQHGMAPMALHALDRATGADHSAAIEASHRWIDHNESGHSMVDVERSTIWRSLERVESRATGAVRGLLETIGVGDERAAAVELNRETRPYEWAWCMYTSAIEAGLPQGRSLV